MNIEELRTFCLALPKATEDVKWGADLCFCIGAKMFCVTHLEGPFSASLKVTDDDFDRLIALPGIVPAPYMARNKWVLLTEEHPLADAELKTLITQSYTLIKQKLPKRLLTELGL